MLYIDTETCGYHGPIILIQYAKDEGAIKIHDVWTSPIDDTLKLIEKFVKEDIVGFNLAFDWFHICQTYTTLTVLKDMIKDGSMWPIHWIEETADAEYKARDVNICLKPQGALDLMLHARKTSYQNTMNRKPIRIKRVPTAIAQDLAYELSTRIPLKDIYFGKKANKTERWKVQDIIDEDGYIIADFKDVVLTFAPTSTLKALAVDATGVDHGDIIDMSEFNLPKVTENGYAPFAWAHREEKEFSDFDNVIHHLVTWNGCWVDYIQLFVDFWQNDERARLYANNDIKYTRDLYKHFGKPEVNDTDSVLAMMVAAVRWKGFTIDTTKLKAMREKEQVKQKSYAKKFSCMSQKSCLAYLNAGITNTERALLTIQGKQSTSGNMLLALAEQKEGDICDNCHGAGCDQCREGIVITGTPTKGAALAQDIIDARHCGKAIELYDKLIKADRFHASFVVIGTKSTRMAGTDDLNAQGIKNSPEVRSCFPLSWGDNWLCGGDFSGFEVAIADAIYKDEELHRLLLEGKKIHALFGMSLFKKTYDEIMATSKLDGYDNLYYRAKRGVFAMLYGGESFTLQNRVGIDEETANEAWADWIKRFKQWGEARKRIFDMFCSMRQPDGLGTKVIWKDPADYIESLFGFRRYFTLENMIVKALFEIAEKPPEKWKTIKETVVRRDDKGKQTVANASRSAVIGAAFALQAGNMRAAANHEIQSVGATITKELQRELWKLQPCGIHPWHVQPMQVHDEVLVVSKPELSEGVKTIIKRFLVEYRQYIPLLDIEWHDRIQTWADK